MPTDDRATAAADLLLGEWLELIENPLDAKAARTIPATTTERQDRNEDEKNTSG